MVVVYDSLATEPCAIKLNVDYHDYGVQDELHGPNMLRRKGNILEIRGVAGSQVDMRTSAGINETLKKYPDMKNVGSVYGNWDGTVTQKQVATILPTLPQIDGVLDQGGDGYRLDQAFKTADGRSTIIPWGRKPPG